MVHDERAGPCQGYRLEAGGKVFAFSGDTAWTEALIPLAAGADVLLVECYAYDIRSPTISTTRRWRRTGPSWRRRASS